MEFAASSNHDHACPVAKAPIGVRQTGIPGRWLGRFGRRRNRFAVSADASTAPAYGNPAPRPCPISIAMARLESIRTSSRNDHRVPRRMSARVASRGRFRFRRSFRPVRRRPLANPAKIRPARPFLAAQVHRVADDERIPRRNQYGGWKAMGETHSAPRHASAPRSGKGRQHVGRACRPKRNRFALRSRIRRTDPRSSSTRSHAFRGAGSCEPFRSRCEAVPRRKSRDPESAISPPFRRKTPVPPLPQVRRPRP